MKPCFGRNFGVSRAKPLPPPHEIIQRDNAVKSLPHATSNEPVDPGPSGDHVWFILFQFPLLF